MLSSEKFIPCLLHLLVPIARICIRHSVKLKEVQELLKRAFVTAAELELKSSNQEINVSRIHLMTGVHRPDISRIHLNPKLSPLSSVINKVIGRWQLDRRYLLKGNEPRILSIKGTGSEFFKLVRQVNSDINPYSVLFELERIGAVERNNHSETASLIVREYIPKGDIEGGFAMVGRDIDDLITTAEKNTLSEDNTSLHHLSTEYDKVPVRFEPTITAWINSEGSKFHKKIRNFLSKYDIDINPHLKHSADEKTMRIAFGSFSRIQKDETPKDI